MGFNGAALYGVRVADASIIEAKAAPDSAVSARVTLGVAKGVDPCSMRLLIVQREWRLSDSAAARVMFDDVSTRLARLHAAPVTIHCGWTRGQRPEFKQLAVGGGLASYISVVRDRTTDSAEVARRSGADEYLKTLKPDLVFRPPAPPAVTDSAALRTRYSVRAEALPGWGKERNAMMLAYAPMATGATACARMRARAWQ